MLDHIEKDPQSFTIEEIRETYFKFIGSVCDTITIKDLDGMHWIQLGALIKAVLKHITGGMTLNDTQKKNTTLN